MPNSLDKPAISKADAVEMMVEYVRRNLALDDKKETSTKDSVMISGKGVCGVHKGNPFELEMIVNLEPTWDSKDSHLIKERIRAIRRKAQPHRAILFPKSIDYSSAAIYFESPFFQAPDLLSALKQMMHDEKDAANRGGLRMILERYARFERGDVKKLSRLEWKYALHLNGSKCAYFNPLHQRIDIHEFARFEPHLVIPANRGKDQKYFWEFVLKGAWPDKTYERKAMTFAGIQKGLHDCVRRIIGTEHIEGGFTLLQNGKYGALPVEHGEVKMRHYSPVPKTESQPRRPYQQQFIFK